MTSSSCRSPRGWRRTPGIPPEKPLSGVPIGELGLERDWFNAALDGAEDAVEEMVAGLAALITHPIRTAEGAATRLSATAAKLPVLSLTAKGALAIKQAAVPTGAAVAALGTGAGAVYILMESNARDNGPQGPSSHASERQGHLTSTNVDKAIKTLRERIREHRQKINGTHQALGEGDPGV